MKLISQGNHAEPAVIENILNSRGFSMSPKYVLQKGNTYKALFKVDKVLSRADLAPVSKRRKEISSPI